MGLEEIYKKIDPEGIGRDKFIRVMQDNGLGVPRKRSFRKTTDSRGVTRFPNRLEGFEVTGVNQCFVSDITYFDLNGKFYYLTFIMDLYNREVVGYSASKRMHTEVTTLPALEMVVRNRGKAALQGAIIHSDGGGQYYAESFKNKTSKSLKMINSMGKECYDNAHAERLNGTLKNAYIIPYHPKNFNDLKCKAKKAVEMYNKQKPHKALDGKTPVQYRLAS